MNGNDTTLHGMRIAILVTEGFEQAELTQPREALAKQGVQTQIISQALGRIQGFNHHDKGDQFEVDLTFAQADPEQFDGILLPGGVINGDQLRMLPEARQFVKHIDEAGKPIFVICHGGWILISSGLVEDRTMTSWPSLQDDVRNAGGHWVDQEVVVDGNWVSSRQPADIPAFNQKMLELLYQRQSGQALIQRQEQLGIGLAG